MSIGEARPLPLAPALLHGLQCMTKRYKSPTYPHMAASFKGVTMSKL